MTKDFNVTLPLSHVLQIGQSSSWSACHWHHQQRGWHWDGIHRQCLPVELIGMNLHMMCDYIKFFTNQLLCAHGHHWHFKTGNLFESMETLSLQGKKLLWETRQWILQKAAWECPRCNKSLPLIPTSSQMHILLHTFILTYFCPPFAPSGITPLIFFYACKALCKQIADVMNVLSSDKLKNVVQRWLRIYE